MYKIGSSDLGSFTCIVVLQIDYRRPLVGRPEASKPQGVSGGVGGGRSHGLPVHTGRQRPPEGTNGAGDVRGYKNASISRQRSYLGRTFDGGRRQNLRLPRCPPVRPTGLYSPVPTAFPRSIFCSGRLISHIYVSKAFTYLSNRELRRSDFVKVKKTIERARLTSCAVSQGKTTA